MTTLIGTGVYPEPSCEDGMIRLSPNGPSPNEGRVEMCYQNIWGAVYDQSWSQYDAAVACAQLNFSRTGQIVFFSLFKWCVTFNHLFFVHI